MATLKTKFQKIQVPNFNNIIQHGNRAGFIHMREEMERMPDIGKVDEAVEQRIMQSAKNVAAETTAVGLARTGAHRMSYDMKSTMRDRAGKPSTNVILPNGDAFDTRYISASAGKHGTNNRLGDAKEKAVHSGMLSNLKIDYSNPSEEFKLAASKLDGTHT